MIKRYVSEMSSTEQESILARVPLLRELRQLDEDQYKNVLIACSVVDASDGELVIERGSEDKSICFLLTGELSVYSHDVEGAVLNNIIAGEMFGDLAILDGAQRKVTVAVAQGVAKASYLIINVETFGELNDFSFVSLVTKLKFYRAITYSIRWRIELKRVNNTHHPLVPVLKSVDVFTGDKGSIAELHSLYLQARQLACLLTGWDGNSYCDETILQEISHA